MKITYRWIKEFLSFPLTPRQMIDQLTEIGHEVEEVIDLGLLDNPIRIARILAVEPHPDAKNLTLCTVDDGSEGGPIRVVCGAPNVEAGQVAVLARVGARLPNGTVLERAEIRGVVSEGMLLAPVEMGLGTEHDGILLLDEKAPVGEGYDLIIDLSITPNRADCLSIHGLARDLAAANGEKVFLRPNRPRETYLPADANVRVTVKDIEGCPRYTARLIRGVRIGPSPRWIQLRLLAVGLRPINNVVDVTNYVLLERGHPMHAFDYDRLAGHEIQVRLARAGEKIRLIDETILDLAENQDLVIADAEHPVAFAGIMGGADSEVTQTTENIVLESAYFNPAQIRRSVQRTHITTDSSFRFERGTDQAVLADVLDRATCLITELAGGEVSKGILDSQPKPIAPKTVLLRTDRACQVLGIDISRTRIADILASLGFEVLRTDRENLVVAVPSYRVDVQREEDVYEEIIRIHGYDKLPATIPYLPASPTSASPIVPMRRLLQDTLVGFGFHETISFSFLSPDLLESLGIDGEKVLRLMNPLSRDHAAMRPELAPVLIRNLLYNQNRGNRDLKLFEVGKVYLAAPGEPGFEEKEALGLAMMGIANQPSWRENAREADFHDLKGIVEIIVRRVCSADARFSAGGPGFLHPGRRAEILVGDTAIGWMGELAPRLRQELGFKARPLLAQIFLDPLLSVACTEHRSSDVPRFPGMERDLALLLDTDIPAEAVEDTIRQAAGELLESIALFDFYVGPQVPDGKKSLAYRLVYRHAQRTLTEGEVDGIQKKILDALSSKLKVDLRG